MASYRIHKVPKASLTLINLFVRLYPGNRVYPSDNWTNRQKFLREALLELAKAGPLNSPVSVISVANLASLDHLLSIFGDWLREYPLYQKTIPDVIIYVDPATYAKHATLNTTTAVSPAADLDLTQYRLSEQLYTVDDLFAPAEPATQLVINEPPAAEEVTPAESGLPGVLRYFPQEMRWHSIYTDPDLQRLAIEVEANLAARGEGIDEPETLPAGQELFNAFRYMISEPKVVILGQDPYHTGVAHGLAFSVRRGVAVPPSLQNIYKALANNFPGSWTPPPAKMGELTAWAERGVLLLNTALTVRKGQASVHLDIWHAFTDRLIRLISSTYPKLVFMLWGKSAKERKRLIDRAGGHLILEFNHPSPIMPNNTFPSACQHFSEANAWLERQGKSPIDWSLA
jgi:uracil-DNA glycosylase